MTTRPPVGLQRRVGALPAVPAAAEAQRRALRRAVELRELREGELWLSFFALGGTAEPAEVERFLDGGELRAGDRTLLAQAANERLRERLSALHVPVGRERPARSPAGPPGTALTVLLEEAPRTGAGGFGALTERAGRALGVHLVLYLVDDEQRTLVPFDPPRGDRGRRPLAVERTLAGRAFRLGRTQTAVTGRPRWWIPVLDGAHRTGVLDVAPTRAADLRNPLLRREFEVVGLALGRLVSAAAATGDAVERVRRTGPHSVAAELLWRLLPPLSADTGRFSVSALLEPAADVGGDVFDYALAERHVDLAVLDAMGHSVQAGLMASVALAAHRAARRRGAGLLEQASAVDAVLQAQFPDGLVTGVLLHADLETGRLTYVGAGHPPPVVLRAGRAVADLVQGRRTPFGLPPPDGGPVLGEFGLQPGDWLVLHTDGVEEARDAAGEFFGRARLVDFVERAVAADFGPAETVRRLVRAILEHQGGALQDDATVLVARWTGKDGGGS